MKYNEIIKKIKDEGMGAFDTLDIEYKTYLPYNIKFALANMLAVNVLDEDENGVLSINIFKVKMIESFLALRYTNIEKEDNEFNIDDYDFLEESGFYEEIKKGIYYLQTENGIYYSDFTGLCEYLRDVANNLVQKSEKENTGINGLIKQSINDTINNFTALYSTTDGKKTINSFLKELNKNTELKETVDRIFDGLNLSNVKDLFLKKIVNAKFNTNTKEEKVNKKEIKSNEE